MGNYALARFTSPNAGVSVSEAGTDISTTAALGLAVQNLDTHAANMDIANTFTAAQLFQALATFSGGATFSGLATFSGGATFSANAIFNALWSDAAQVSVASAATFALPTTGNNVNVTGTTGITDFSGPATQGVFYKLQFTNATPGAVTSGNHAKLNGNFTTAQNNILYLYWDGTNAWEIGRYTAASAATSIYKKLGSGVATVNQAITSTASPGTDVTSLTVTCTPDGTHDVKITVSMPDIVITSGIGSILVALQKDGAVVDTLFLQAQNTASVLVRGQVGLTYVDAAPTAASHTYKVSAWITATGSLSTIASGSGAAPTNLILVEQIG